MCVCVSVCVCYRLTGLAISLSMYCVMPHLYTLTCIQSLFLLLSLEGTYPLKTCFVQQTEMVKVKMEVQRFCSDCPVDFISN